MYEFFYILYLIYIFLNKQNKQNKQFKTIQNNSFNIHAGTSGKVILESDSSSASESVL